MAAFKLHAAKEDGTLESQVVEFQWNTIARWEVDEDGMAFCFQYTRQDNRPPRWLKVFTPYVSIAISNEQIRAFFNAIYTNLYLPNLTLAVYVPLGLLRSNSRGSQVGRSRRMTQCSTLRDIRCYNVKGFLIGYLSRSSS
jgi:hypothetical protein